MLHRPRALLLALLLAPFGALPSIAAHPAAPGGQPARAGGAAPLDGRADPLPVPDERPRLCVLIAVDQLIPEQLDRLQPWLSGGLARLSREGLVFRQAMLPYGVTETGPGHVTFATGRLPSDHGIIANQWIDPASGRGVYCVADPDARDVTGEGPSERAGSRSWRNVRVPALGDHLALALPGSRVVSIAGKDRAAVGMGGAGARHVLWWDRGRGGFQTSTAYAEELPTWVAEWNAGWVGRVPPAWEPLHPGELPGSGTAPDDREGEGPVTGSRVFPYPLPVPAEDPGAAEDSEDPAARARAASRLSRVVYATPFMDDFVIELAELAVHELALGQGEGVDLLALGLSACDVVGHGYGPYSREVTDLLLRLDLSLARLFETLDEAVGSDGWICVLSSDHGVLELPEELARRGIGARRVDGREQGLAMQRIAGALEEHLGIGRITLQGDAGGLYLGRDALERQDVELAAAAAVARDALLEAAPWVARAWTREEALAVERDTAEPWLALALASFDAERSPDVLYQRLPWHLVGWTNGTSHGSPYPYDRRVPLIFYGPGRAAATSHDPVTPLDAVPTVLRWLGLEIPPELEGTAH